MGKGAGGFGENLNSPLVIGDVVGESCSDLGTAGFTAPLVSGNDVFLIQQTGSALTAYQFDFNVTAVPEPGCVWLLGGLVLLGGRRQKK